jgi:hypothetical protein
VAQTTRRSNTVTLTNGNRVTVTVGKNRSGFYKTVTVKRPNGTSESKTNRRGGATVFNPFGGPYDNSIPSWARR